MGNGAGKLFQDGSEQAALKTQLNTANQKMQQIINAIPGGVARL